MSLPTFRLVKKITVPVSRYAAGGINDTTGLWEQGAVTSFNIEANVQPLPGEELLELRELRRDREYIELYTTTELKTVNESTSKQPDKVVYDGKTYEVIFRESFKMTVLDHYRVIAAKVDE